MHAFKPRTLLYPVFAAMVALGVLGQPTQARAADVHGKSPQALQQEARQIGAQLSAIARKTIAGNKKLQAEGQHYSEHMIKAMQTIGYTPKADGKKMAAIQKALNSGNLSQDERKAKIKEFQGLRMRMVQAQMGVMQDKSLRKERLKLNQDTMLAMKKQDPRAEKLMKRLNEIGKQLRRMARAAQTSHK
jgi:hypothetical protein